MIELAELADLAANLDSPAAEGDAAGRASAAMTFVVRNTACREPSTEEVTAIDVVARAAGRRAA